MNCFLASFYFVLRPIITNDNNKAIEKEIVLEMLDISFLEILTISVLFIRPNMSPLNMIIIASNIGINGVISLNFLLVEGPFNRRIGKYTDNIRTSTIEHNIGIKEKDST